MKQDPSLTWRRTDVETLNLTGMQVAIVGGTGGIGRALSRVMAARGARVLVVGQTFRDAGVSGIEFIQADLSLMREAQRIGRLLPAETLDLVVFTTGIFAAPERQETAEGLERDMAVSYLSRLVILREIGTRLGQHRPAATRKPRVFVMGYPGTGQVGTLDDLNADRAYSAMAVHMNTVAGNEMLVFDAAKRYPKAQVFGLNPGLIRTEIRRNFLGGHKRLFSLIEALIGLLTPSAESYAERLVPLLVSPDLEGHSSALFNQKGQAIRPSKGLTEPHITAFMAASTALAARAGVTVPNSGDGLLNSASLGCGEINKQPRNLPPETSASLPDAS